MIVHKTTTSTEGGLEFILSTGAVDRYGDTIDATGWDTKNFQRNPIALFNHDKNFPIGRWTGLNVKDGALRARLVIAPKGTSPRHDEIRALVDAGILKAVSVGFIPIESEPRARSGGGTRYIKQELVETSLCAIPANPDALLACYKMGVSKETIKKIFKHGKDNELTTHSELVRRSRASTARAKAILARLNNLNLTKKTKPARRLSNAEVQANAKALLVRLDAEKARAAAKAKSDRNLELGYTWQGKRIPASWSLHWYRKNWWDPNS